MPRQSMVLQLQNDEEQRPEGVSLTGSNNTWQSPAGGWLSSQSGSWDQSPAGIGLNRQGEHGGNVATLRGLNFFLTNEGAEGSALYPNQGGVGTWRVVAVVDG